MDLVLVLKKGLVRESEKAKKLAFELLVTLSENQ